MKRKIKGILFALAVGVFMVSMPVRAASAEDSEDIFGQVREQLREAFEDVDDKTAEQIFSFVKEKISEDSFDTEEGLSGVIDEAKEKFQVEIDRKDAQQLVATMEKLEDMGFSAEYVIGKSESLYQEYGADFVDHIDEVVTGAVKNAVSTAVSGFFGNLKESVKGFFTGLFRK